MGQRRNGERHAATARDGLDAEDALSIAAVLHGLATASRVQIVAALQGGPISVGALADAVRMEQSAVSHQLRHLRNLGLVTARRQGRSILYGLLDDHVIDILDQALSHAEHVSLPGGRNMGGRSMKRATRTGVDTL